MHLHKKPDQGPCGLYNHMWTVQFQVVIHKTLPSGCRSTARNKSKKACIHACCANRTRLHTSCVHASKLLKIGVAAGVLRPNEWVHAHEYLALTYTSSVQPWTTSTCASGQWRNLKVLNGNVKVRKRPTRHAAPVDGTQGAHW